MRVGIVAGESSGDTLGAALITALRARVPDVECFGMAGPKMVAAGCEAWASADELSTMGLFEVLRHLPRLLRLRASLVERFKAARPDVFVGIDKARFRRPVEPGDQLILSATVERAFKGIWRFSTAAFVGDAEVAHAEMMVAPETGK